MPKPTTILTSMRLAAGVNSQLVLANDLCTAQQNTLKAIKLAARQGGTLDDLRKTIERLTDALEVRQSDLLRFDVDRQARIAATTYADEGAE